MARFHDRPNYFALPRRGEVGRYINNRHSFWLADNRSRPVNNRKQVYRAGEPYAFIFAFGPFSPTYARVVIGSNPLNADETRRFVIGWAFPCR